MLARGEVRRPDEREVEALHERGRQRQLEGGEEDDLAAGVELPARVQADVEPLRLVVLGAVLEVLQVGDQGVDDLALLAGQQDGLHAVGVDPCSRLSVCRLEHRASRSSADDVVPRVVEEQRPRLVHLLFAELVAVKDELGAGEIRIG